MVSFALRQGCYHRRCSGLHRGAQGWVVNRFHFTGDPQLPQRGLALTRQQPPRCIGLGAHSGQVLFRHIQWKAL